MSNEKEISLLMLIVEKKRLVSKKTKKYGKKRKSIIPDTHLWAQATTSLMKKSQVSQRQLSILTLKFRI